MGPLSPEMKARWKSEQGDIKFDDQVDHARGLSELPRDAAASRRTSPRSSAPHDRASTSSASTTGRRRRRARPHARAGREEMEAGALGIGSSLIYAPGSYATTDELIELCKVAAAYRGKYISHMRSEGDRLIEAVEELIRISREARTPGRDLPPQGGGRVELAEDGPRARAHRGRPRSGPRDHGRHVHLPGRRDRAQRRDAALGAGRRLRGAASSGCATRPSARKITTAMRRRRPTGRTSTWPPARPSACCWSTSRTRR